MKHRKPMTFERIMKRDEDAITTEGVRRSCGLATFPPKHRAERERPVLIAPRDMTGPFVTNAVGYL
jgi:hypothetical protein